MTLDRQGEIYHMGFGQRQGGTEIIMFRGVSSTDISIPTLSNLLINLAKI